MAKKISFFIDGFNLYHALKKNNLKKYKWLDLRQVCESFAPSSYTTSDIFFFTALPTWIPAKSKRHSLYTLALESTGVSVVNGKFKKVTRKWQWKLSIPHRVSNP